MLARGLPGRTLEATSLSGDHASASHRRGEGAASPTRSRAQPSFATGWAAMKRRSPAAAARRAQTQQSCASRAWTVPGDRGSVEEREQSAGSPEQLRAARGGHGARPAPTGRSASRPGRGRSSARATPPSSCTSKRSAPRAHPAPPRAGPRASALRRVVAPREPAGRRPRGAAYRLRDAHAMGMDAFAERAGASCSRRARPCASARSRPRRS